MFISRSIIVCKDAESMHDLKYKLSQLDYPVDILSFHNAKDVLERFISHRIRMIIVHTMFYFAFESYISSMVILPKLIDVVFIDRRLPQWIHSHSQVAYGDLCTTVAI
jgi:ssRNA-specific RNase YbeY (16S rRNA maturation enzyme)